MKMWIFGMLSAFALSSGAQGEIAVPVFRPSDVRSGETPIVIETKREIVAANPLVRRVSTTLTFTNPNSRVMAGELEFPLPEGATVCGYALDVNGTMVPGVVCGKEEARVAFENEMRKGIDPGLVEHVKGKVWKTRIYPLMPRTPRKARVDYIEPLSAAPGTVVVERDGDAVFVGEACEPEAKPLSDRLRGASRAVVCWDASTSRKGKAAADRNVLECLPEKGDFRLLVFRNVVEEPVRFGSRADLLKALDALVYDGATCLEKARTEASRLGKDENFEVFVFTDEIDLAAVAKRRVRVRKLGAGEKAPGEAKGGRLLATAWAADFIADHAGDAARMKNEFLALGRKYGVASPVTSLIVLERLDQYLTYKVEPPKELSFHDEWVKRRAADDDPIDAARAATEHKAQLLRLWEERVKWWKDPIPPKKTPRSGLFDMAAAQVVAATPVGRAAAGPVATAALRCPPTGGAGPRATLRTAARDAADVECECAADDSAGKSAEEGHGAGATVKIAKWDPKTPYLTVIGAAKEPYAEYLRQRDVYGQAPSFFLDCAGWFFKAKQRLLAIRILSNLAEMKLEDAALWRTMGWRLREAEAYEEAIDVFRHVLEMRGEESQSKRDLALVLTESGKAKKDLARLTEAVRLLHAAAFEPVARRSARRGNDMQASVMALEELNGLLAWAVANGLKLDVPTMDPAFRRDLPLALRITLSWDVDETDVDLHVLEPDGEEAYYGHRRTSSGGFVSEDVTTGYGPEEYLRKQADKGVYKILAHYFASHLQALTGAATVTATVYTDWGTSAEKREVLSFRLDKPKDKCPIGEVTLGVQ